MLIYTSDHVIPEPQIWLLLSLVFSQPLQGHREEGLAVSYNLVPRSCSP